jgi:hypothetical protein
LGHIRRKTSKVSLGRCGGQVERTAATLGETNTVVGNDNEGKRRLSKRLALDTYKETDFTVAAWATQWKLPLDKDNVSAASNRRRGQHPPATKMEREFGL